MRQHIIIHTNYTQKIHNMNKHEQKIFGNKSYTRKTQTNIKHVSANRNDRQ